jgi:hypothetical protein
MFLYYSLLVAVVGGVLIGSSIRLRVRPGLRAKLDLTAAQSGGRRRVSTYIFMAGAVLVGVAVPMLQVELGARLAVVVCQDLAWGALLIGFVLAVLGVRRRRRGGRKLVALGLLCMPIAYGLKVTPRVMSNGWVGAVPTTILILQVESLSADSLIQEPERLVAGDPKRRPSDWTLIGRYRAGQMAKWQERWLLDKPAKITVIPLTSDGLAKATRVVRAFPGEPVFGLQAADATYRALNSSDPALRVQAAHIALDLFVGGKNECQREGTQYIREHQSELAASLAPLLDDDSWIVAWAAIETLEQCAEQRHRLVPILKDVASKARDDTRGRQARRALESWGVDVTAVREQMLAATREASAPMRAIATEQLGRVWHDEDSGVTQRLSELARDEDDEVACAAVKAMVRGSLKGEPFALVLEQLRSERLTRECFFQALVLRWHEPHLVEVLGLLDDRDPRMRIATAEWLAAQVQNYGTDQADWNAAVRALKTKLADPEPSIRTAAKRAIAAIARARG